MDDEMKGLKSLLRSLVVSSPTQMDVRSLQRDYRNMVGAPLPLAKYGHRDPVAFLKERFSDCFVMTGPSSNPVLTLIVPDTLKHIDQFVQKQKVPSTAKFKSKRRSIPETVLKPQKQDLIFETFVKDTPRVPEEPEQSEVKAPDVVPEASHYKQPVANHQVTSTDVKNFLRKRLPLYNSLHSFEELASERGATISSCQDDDSGKQLSSSNSSTKALQLEELKADVMDLISAAPGGVWCTDLIRLYR
uniref:HTH OST-type domain-containing protein n=1 Tax=Heliothis virescens TaxID=7102 RepID=A0A2A4JLG2_HELVI